VASKVRWFALTVKPQHERKTALALEVKEYPFFLPLYRAKRRWSDRVKELDLPLFPGYVFSQFAFDQRTPILQIPGVVSVVHFGNLPTPIPDEEIEAVRKMVGSGRAVEPWPFLKVGRRVRIDGGSMDGVEGVLLEIKNSLRVVVSIEILQRSVAVEIDRDQITVLPEPKPTRPPTR
jgi:transcription antitermination factor NusG